MFNIDVIIKVILGTAGSVILALGIVALAFFIAGFGGWAAFFVFLLVLAAVAAIGAAIYSMLNK